MDNPVDINKLADRDIAAEMETWLMRVDLAGVHISELPSGSIFPQFELYAKAVNLVYNEQINEIKEYLIDGNTSVLVYAEQIAPYLMGWILENHYEFTLNGQPQNANGPFYWRVGASAPPIGGPGANAALPVRYLSALQLCMDRWRAADHDGPFVIEDLDLLLLTDQSLQLTSLVEPLYTLRLLSRQLKQKTNSKIVLLAFADPRFGRLPEQIEEFFPKIVTLGGVPRERIWQILSTAQIQGLFPGIQGNDFFTIEQQKMLAKYLSMFNPIRLIDIVNACVNDNEADTERKLQRLCGGQNLVPRTQEADIAGYLKVKEEIKAKLISPICNRASLLENEALAAELLPKGVLLYGPPGTGKTEITKWVANAVDASMQSVSGPELKSQFVGETERQIRQLFARARQSAPAIILIDEVDALMPSREAHTQEYAASMVAQLLSEMDGLRSEEAVIVIATTNRRERIDASFMRPGRFYLQIQVDFPEEADIQAILALYGQKFNLQNFDAQRVATRIWQSSVEQDDEAKKVREDLQQAVSKKVIHRGIVPLLEAVLLTPLRERMLARQFARVPQETVREIARITSTRLRWSGDHLRAFCVEWLRLQRERPTFNSEERQEEIFETISRHYGLDIPHS